MKFIEKLKTYNESIDLGDGRIITLETGKLQNKLMDQ